MKITYLQKKKKKKRQRNNKTLIIQRLIPNFDFCRQQLGFKDEKPLTTSVKIRSIGRRHLCSQDQNHVANISSVKIRSIGRRHLRSQDQDRGCKHFLSQDQIQRSQHQDRGRRHLRSQDQDCGHKHYLRQNQVLWSQTIPSSRLRLKSPLVANNSIIKIRIEEHL